MVNRIEKVESSWFRGKFNNLPKVNFMKLRFETGETAAVSKLLLNAEGSITDIKKKSLQVLTQGTGQIPDSFTPDFVFEITVSLACNS